MNSLWKEKDNVITREFEFADFAGALVFVNRVGELAQKADHHPDILLHSWNKVRITLSTHDKGGVTQKDYDLAEEIDGIEMQ